MEAYTLLDTDAKVTSYMNSLRERNIRTIGIDTEGEFNLHRYGEHLCLIQVYDNSEFVLIDPVGLQSGTLRSFFESKILKIMYDASGDRTLVFRRYGINIATILDLLPAVELLELERKDLGSVTRAILNIDEKPKANYQRYNWTRRPIEEAALGYAIDDVRYLFELKDELISRVYKAGFIDDYIRRNIEVQTRVISSDPVPGVMRKGRFRNLSSSAKKFFTAAFGIRDGFARDLDLPPNSVVSNEDLFRLASKQMTVADLRFSGRIRRELGDKIRSAIANV
jgi:ribonuclease D